QQQICVLHELIELSEERLFPCKRRAARVDRRVDPLFLCFLKQFDHEIYLKQRFSPAHRYSAAVLPVGSVPQRLRQQLVRALLLPHLHVPGIRVVAELAPHRTSCDKNNKTYAWPVDRAKTLCRMDISVHKLSFRDVVKLNFTTSPIVHSPVPF